VYFKNVKTDGWRVRVMSHDGLVRPKSWKSQVLRLVATLHGGIDLQSSNAFAGGLRYWMGEATRIIARYEDLFYDGERIDELARSEQIAYPNLLVLRHGDERLVLLFNETDVEKVVTLENLELSEGARAYVAGSDAEVPAPAVMSLTIPPEDVQVVHVCREK
jgi:hypothetical protein